jgi:uridine kinase
MRKKSNIKKKVIAVVGTTSSGKTSLAVDLARRFDGEIISADSLDISIRVTLRMLDERLGK